MPKQTPLAQGAEAIITLVTSSSSSKKTKTPSPKISPITKSPSRSDLTKSIAKKSIASHSEQIVIKNRIKKSYRIPELDKRIRERRTRAETKLLIKASKIINCPVPQESKDKTKIILPFIDGEKLSEHLDNFPLEKQKQILKQIGKDIAKLHNENIIHGDLTTSNMILVEEKKERGSNGMEPNQLKPDYDNPSKKKYLNVSVNLINHRARMAEWSTQSVETRYPSGCVGSIPTPGATKNLREEIYLIDFGLGYFNGKYEDKAVDIHLLKQALEAKHFKHWKELYKEFEKAYKSINKPEAEKVFNQLIKVEKRGRYKG